MVVTFSSGIAWSGQATLAAVTTGEGEGDDFESNDCGHERSGGDCDDGDDGGGGKDDVNDGSDGGGGNNSGGDEYGGGDKDHGNGDDNENGNGDGGGNHQDNDDIDEEDHHPFRSDDISKHLPHVSLSIPMLLSL